ncbi:uncharacterized protein LOC107266079 [Cephus cinctus]|uniref:Uncharacterized protein LOC107266079 n=1 Tax=Cephus cinctus TaxID=211228 RepID=A0AAJ7BQ69_CEPCN|nr:uncharacterized protein LOC107266079 [Cephus cinctus]
MRIRGYLNEKKITMPHSSNLLRILLILLIFHKKASRGIECYQCRSDKNDECTRDNADIKYLQNCPDSCNYCRKSTNQYYFTDSSELIVIRECAKLWTEGKECYRGRYTRDSFQYICECRGSGCNRSSTSVSSFYHIIIFRLLPFTLLPYSFL